MSLVTYLECLPGLALAWLLIIGVCHLGRLISDPWPRAHVRVVVRAPMPQPEPVHGKGRLSDPNDLASWVPVSHDDVLFFLSPELRGEFANSPNFFISPLEAKPVGLADVLTALQGAVSTGELRRGFKAPSVPVVK